MDTEILYAPPQFRGIVETWYALMFSIAPEIDNGADMPPGWRYRCSSPCLDNGRGALTYGGDDASEVTAAPRRRRQVHGRYDIK